ncbi:MAG TPA: NAD(P)H-binding protein [Thermoanaerobaculia bacterium]|nr:NAD(P)H-binding protein [Thermoanaerobaculia bacterium]
MKILVTGGTGTVGKHLVAELVARGARVAVATREAGRAAALPAGARAEVGDLGDPAVLRRALDGQEALFLLSALRPDEASWTLRAIAGAREAGVRRVVYLSVTGADRSPWIPHFGAKVAGERALAASELEWTVLRPNSFLQNDLRYRELLLGPGVYPQPIGSIGAARVDVRDVAAAAATALTTEGHAGATYEIAGPETQTGADIARVWSEALGREIVYGGDDLEAWEAHMTKLVPPWMAYDLRWMYDHFQRHGARVGAADLERQRSLVGRPPRGHRELAAEAAAAWRG